MKFQQTFKIGTNRGRPRRKKTKKIRSLRCLAPMRTLAANENTRVVCIPQFLSTQEINSVLETVEVLDLPVYTNNADDDINEHGEPVHVTSYLNTANSFETTLPWLAQRIRKAVCLINKTERWGFHMESEKVNVRVAEYHEMYPAGSLSGMDHCDVGSLITIDIMLQEGQTGGIFQTVNNSHHTTSHEQFAQGDALVFVSHKHHRVTQLQKGVRKVLVVEYWRGEQRKCGHRCDVPHGLCCFSTKS